MAQFDRTRVHDEHLVHVLHAVGPLDLQSGYTMSLAMVGPSSRVWICSALLLYVQHEDIRLSARLFSSSEELIRALRLSPP